MKNFSTNKSSKNLMINCKKKEIKKKNIPYKQLSLVKNVNIFRTKQIKRRN